MGVADDPGRFVVWVAGILYLGLWVWPLRSSLWTDELGTWWVVKDGLGDAVSRSVEFHGQSPAFYVIAWVAKELGGRHELVLRLPAFLAASGAIVLFYRLVRRLSDEGAAMVAAVAFIGLGGIAFAATDARPYGVALLASIAATSSLVVWLDEGRWRWGWGFVLATIATIALHFMFALVVPVLAVYAAGRLRKGTSAVPPVRLLGAAILIVVGIVPLTAQLSSLWGRRGTLAVPNVATADDLLRALLPVGLVAGAAIGVAVARAQGPIGYRSRPASPGARVLVVTWLTLPVVALFAASVLTDVMFFAPRYYVVSAPAAAAVFGWVVAGLRPVGATRVVVVVFAIVTVLLNGGALKNGEDWRGAIAFTRSISHPGTVILVHPAFVESAQIGWLEDPERRSYLLSPLSFYELAGQIVPLPFVLDGPAEEYLEEVVDSQLGDADRFLIVTNYSEVPFASWLDGRLEPDGWSSDVVGVFGTIRVIEFTKSEAARSPG